MLCSMGRFGNTLRVEHAHGMGDNTGRPLCSLKSQVVLLQTAHSWANAGVLLGARMHRERVAFETIKVSG